MKYAIPLMLVLGLMALLVSGCQADPPSTTASVAATGAVASETMAEKAEAASKPDTSQVTAIAPPPVAPAAATPDEATTGTGPMGAETAPPAPAPEPRELAGVFEDTSERRTISVTGQGKATASPDVAILELGVESIGETVQEARAQSAEATIGLIEALTDAGVAEDDIGTRSIRINPRMNYETQTVTGYEVSNRLVVKIRDLELVGAAIDGAAAAAGDSTRLRGIDFSVEDTSPLEEEARGAAVENATDKAGQLAEGLGVTLGRVVSVNESDFGGIPYPRAAAEFGLAGAAAADAGTPVLAGDVEITVTILAVFEIEEGESQ